MSNQTTEGMNPADAMRAAARAKPQGIHVELTDGQWFRSSNNDFKPQAVWTVEEARRVQRWLADVLPTQCTCTTTKHERMENRACPVHFPREPGALHPDTALLDGLEAAVNEGACPGVINDDDGRWAVSDEGMQNVPTGDGPIDIHTTFFIEAAKWKPTIREAICTYLSERGSDEQPETKSALPDAHNPQKGEKP